MECYPFLSPVTVSISGRYYTDGSALVEVRTGSSRRQLREIRGQVRLAKGKWATVRLWTSLLDWRQLPAKELMELMWSPRAGGKTVTIAVSEEQFAWMKKAIANPREDWEVLLRTQQLSAEYILQNLPNPPRRKRVSKKRFGLV